MTRSKVTEARETVVSAARLVARSRGAEVSFTLATHALHCLYKAVDELDALVPAPVVNAVGASVVGAPETSAQAARLIFPGSASNKRRIINSIAAHGIATDEQLERRLHLLHTTCSSARNSLVLDGWLEDSRQRALTSSKRKAVLWQLTPAAWAQLKGNPL